MTRPAGISRFSPLSLGAGKADGFLTWLLAVFFYFALLAGALALAVERLATDWSADTQGKATVQMPRQIEGDAVAGALALEKVLALLHEEAGVASVEVIGDKAIADLLEPWLGGEDLTESLPLPYLLVIELRSGEEEAVERLREALAAAVPSAQLDDHQEDLGRLLSFAGALQLAALLAVAMVAGGIVMTMALMARLRLLVHRQEIEILHLIGARDPYIAGQFQRRALWQGLWAATIAASASALTIWLAGFWLAGEGLLVPSGLRLTLLDWPWLGVGLALGVGLVVITTRLAVLRGLARLP